MDTSEMWSNKTIVLAFQTSENCYQQKAFFSVNVELTGEVLPDLGGTKDIEFENEVKEEYFVILQKKNSISLGPWDVFSQKARLDEKYKRFVNSGVKVTTANEVKSYTGTEMLKKAFSETLSVE
jgi:hypothetical protein